MKFKSYFENLGWNNFKRGVSWKHKTEFGIELDRNLFKRNSDWIDQVIFVEFERLRLAMQLLKKIEVSSVKEKQKWLTLFEK